MRWALAGGLAVLLGGGLGCNTCRFWARCDGAVLERCGNGVDQQFGREINRRACAAPNPVCVEVDGGHAATYAGAQCAASTAPCDPASGGKPQCGPLGVERCDPTLRVEVVVAPCAGGCEQDPAGAHCR